MKLVLWMMFFLLALEVNAIPGPESPAPRSKSGSVVKRENRDWSKGNPFIRKEGMDEVLKFKNRLNDEFYLDEASDREILSRLWDLAEKESTDVILVSAKLTAKNVILVTSFTNISEQERANEAIKQKEAAEKKKANELWECSGTCTWKETKEKTITFTLPWPARDSAGRDLGYSPMKEFSTKDWYTESKSIVLKSFGKTKEEARKELDKECWSWDGIIENRSYKKIR